MKGVNKTMTNRSSTRDKKEYQKEDEAATKTLRALGVPLKSHQSNVRRVSAEVNVTNEDTR